MIATIEQHEQGYVACSERHIKHSVQEVWAMLTDNAKLDKWFQELRVGELREGGFMKFDMSEGKFEQLEITAYAVHSVLEFDWFGDIVRFEVRPEKNGSILIFIERFETLTEQRVKDLAGWHVCLDVIQSLLDGKSIHSREAEWKKWYNEYERVLNGLGTVDKA